MKLQNVICALSALAALMLPATAIAEMLDEPACNNLKNEKQRLAAAGVQTEMLYGPDWAKANLPGSRLEEIKRLMEVEEALSFRCPLPPPPKAAEPVAAAPANDDTKATDGNTEPKPKRKKKAKKPDPESAADAPAANAADPGVTDEKPKRKAKAKKKQPADDAYVPPPASDNALIGGAGEPVPQPPR